MEWSAVKHFPQDMTKLLHPLIHSWCGYFHKTCSRASQPKFQCGQQMLCSLCHSLTSYWQLTVARGRKFIFSGSVVTSQRLWLHMDTWAPIIGLNRLYQKTPHPKKLLGGRQIEKTTGRQEKQEEWLKYFIIKMYDTFKNKEKLK